MDLELLRLTSLRPSQLFTTRDTAALGLSGRQVKAWLAESLVTSVLPGIYAPTTAWTSATAERRLALRAHATALRAGTPVLLSHTSAACLHGLPLVMSPAEVDRHRVHLTRGEAGNASKRTGHTVHQRYGVDQVAPAIDGIAVVLPVLAAFGVAEIGGFLAGVVALDAAVHQGSASISQAQRWHRRLRQRPGMKVIPRVIAATDGQSESPLETQARLVISALGYRMRPQVRLLDAQGHFVARVDGLIEDLGVVIEVDGRGKYVGTGDGSPHAVIAEKRRESAITNLGYAVVRLDRVDIGHPAQVEQRILDAAHRVQAGMRLRR